MLLSLAQSHQGERDYRFCSPSCLRLPTTPYITCCAKPNSLKPIYHPTQPIFVILSNQALGRTAIRVELQGTVDAAAQVQEQEHKYRDPRDLAASPTSIHSHSLPAGGVGGAYGGAVVAAEIVKQVPPRSLALSSPLMVRNRQTCRNPRSRASL